MAGPVTPRLRAVEDEVEDLPNGSSRASGRAGQGPVEEGLGLTEPEAFRWIQKTAMDLRKSMREVAEGVIEHSKSGRKPGR